MGKLLSLHEIRDILQEDQRQLDKTVDALKNRETRRSSNRQAKHKTRQIRRAASQK
jgi:hypothetical protein